MRSTPVTGSWIVQPWRRAAQTTPLPSARHRSADSSTRANSWSARALITNSGLTVATMWWPPCSTSPSIRSSAASMSRQSTRTPRTRTWFIGVIIIRRLQTKMVAVDLNPATREVVTGTEIFAREVGSRLEAAAPELRWRFFASRPRAGLGIDVTVTPFPRLWSQVRLPLALTRQRPDLLFVPAHAIPFAWVGKALTVVHDLAFERHPNAYTSAERAYLQLTTRWAVRRCPLLITISESTRSDLVALYGVKPER